MTRDVQKISQDIASSRLFAPSGRDAVTESDPAQPTATNAPPEAPTQTGHSQPADSATVDRETDPQGNREATVVD